MSLINFLAHWLLFSYGVICAYGILFTGLQSAWKPSAVFWRLVILQIISNAVFLNVWTGWMNL